MNNQQMIELTNIKKSFASGIFRGSSHVALDNISFAVKPTEVFGIIGPNGAGKSTLLKILMGFILPDGGDAYIDDISISDSSCHASVGFLPEHPSLYLHLTPREHLAFACQLNESMNRTKSAEAIQDALNVVDLADVIDVPVKRFSKGMQQRTALAYALLFNPKILILDEPMSGLDPLGRHLVIDIMRQFNRGGTTIIFCSHILSDIERICDRIGILNKGRLVSVIEPASLNSLKEKIPSGQTPLEHYFLSQVKDAAA